jgi:hypothetical protein
MKKCVTCDLITGGWMAGGPSPKKIFLLFILRFLTQPHFFVFNRLAGLGDSVAHT